MFKARGTIGVLLVAAAVLGASAAPASAAGYDCEASALRVSLLGSAPLEPLVANRGVGACQTLTKTLADLPAELPLLDVDLAIASTVLTGAKMSDQTAIATGGLLAARVKPLPQLPIALPTPQIADSLSAVQVPLGPGAALLGLPPEITVDLKPAINALLPEGRLPDADVLGVKVAHAQATATCQNGQPVLSGTSQLVGVSVFGQELPVNAAVEQAVSLVDTSSIDLSKIDLSKVVLPAGLSFTDPAVGTLLQAAIKPVLDGLPAIEIPPALALVKLVPGEQVRVGNRLIQRALHAKVDLLGRNIVDLVVGEASVAEDAVNCVDATDLTLACTKRRLVLTDVVGEGDSVRLEGVADKALVGRTVDLRFRATDKVVAHAKVLKDGSFATYAPMPPNGIRATNESRYMAEIGDEQSLDLKLMRRMIVSSMKAKGGKVIITGRVVKPLADPMSTIVVKRRISCKKTEKVGETKPNADGSFRIEVPAPVGQAAAVYRLSSFVRKTESNPKVFPTFTLPRGVNLL